LSATVQFLQNAAGIPPQDIGSSAQPARFYLLEFKERPTMFRQTLLLASLYGFILTTTLSADEQPEADTGVSYYKQILPIFQANCQGCHQPAKQGGDYVMTQFTGMLAGGESGDAAILPGKPDESYLVNQITPADGEAAMPKGKKPLSGSELELIRSWISEGAKDDTPATALQVFDAEHPPIYQASPVITSVDFSPAGDLLAVAGYHEVLLHKADGSGLVARLVGMSERIETARFSPDGTKLVVAGGSPGRFGEIQVWNVEQRELLFALSIGYDTLYGASWSPNGKLISFGCPDNTVRAIDADTGKQILFNGAHSDWVLDTVFSVNSDHIITVSRDRSMKLMHVETQRFIDNITSITPGALQGGLHAVARHPSKDELLSGGADGAPRIYRMIREKARKIGDDFNLIRAFPKLPGRVFSVAFSGDGNQIAAGSSLNGKGQINIYNYADAKLISSFDVAAGGVYSVTFSHDNKIVAAAGFDGQIYLIEAASGNLVQSFIPVEITETVAAAEE
jgi:WD40 repeat protein